VTKHVAREGAENVQFRSMGKSFKVTAMFDNTEETNEWLAKNRDHGVIACFGPFVIVANIYDAGKP
jgi:hypothetical protein